MKKIISSIFFFCVAITAMLGQDSFNLQYASATAINNSLYDRITFLDSRPEYQYNMVPISGQDFVQKLNYFINHTIKNSNAKGELLFQLSDLNISKSNNNTNEVHLRANLFNKQNSSYYFIDSVDVNLNAQPISDLQITVSGAIFSFVNTNLTKTYTNNEPYTLDDIYNFDLVEKNTIKASTNKASTNKASTNKASTNKAFTNKALTDGIYVDFNDFANQYPLDDELTVDYMKNGDVKDVKATNNKLNKTIAVNPKDVFVIVSYGQAFVSYDNHFIPLTKHSEDYYFVYKAPKGFDVSYLPTMNGIFTGGNNSKSDKNQIIYKIDHTTGDILPAGRL